MCDDTAARPGLHIGPEKESWVRDFMMRFNPAQLFLIFMLISLACLPSRAPAAPGIELTPEEQAWLDKKHTVRVRIADFPPFIFIDEGKEPTGITIDYLNLIAKQTGIIFEYHLATTPWPEALKAMQNRELQGPDLMTSMMRTPEREKTLSFSKNYSSNPRVIFARTDEQSLSDMDGLIGRTIAVPRGTQIHNQIQTQYPDIKLLLGDTDLEALKAVTTDQADAYVGNLTLASFLILQNGFTNVKVVGPSPFGDHVFSFGSRKDWPELSSIIDKGIDSVTREERSRIRNKHLAIRYEHGATPADVLKWVLIVVGASSGIVLIFVFWNKQLSQKVKERTSQLMETESRFRATFEQVAVGVAHVSLEGRFLLVNEKFCSIVGYSEDEIRELTFQDITHPDDLDADLEYVQQLLNGGRENYSMDKRCFRKDGSIVRINLTVAPVFDRGGSPKYFVSVIKDISDRRQAEEDLRRNHDFLEHLTSATPDVIVSIKMPERTIEWVNDSFDVLGLETGPDDVRGQSVRQFYANPEDYHAVGELQKDAIRKGEKFIRTEVMALRKDGRAVPVELVATFYREEGEVVRITAFARDISDRRQAEDALRKSHDYLQHLTVSIPDAFFSVKMPERTIEWVNDSFRVLGYEPEECIGESTEPLYASPEEYQAVGTRMAEAIREGKDVLRTETMLRRKNGEVFPAEINVSVHREYGEVTSVTALARNITERKNVEREVSNLRDELFHATRRMAMGELTTAIAHELNQPLAAILTNAHAAKRFMKRDTPLLEEVEEILDDIISDDRRAADIINKLRGMLKKERHDYEDISINEVIREVLALTRNHMLIGMIELETAFAENIPPVSGDRIQLQQVFLNLVLNAAEAFQDADSGKRKISIETGVLGDSKVRIRISDTGPGLGDIEKNQLFDPFFTTKKEGMGVGLAISKTIVELHGGRIGAEDSPEGGAAFHVDLPCAGEG